MMDFDVRVFLRAFCWVGLFLVCSLVFCSAAMSIRDREIARYQQEQRQKRLNIQWCTGRGGGWMPVGGDQYRTVYGCVFPPNGGER